MTSHPIPSPLSLFRLIAVSIVVLITASLICYLTVDKAVQGHFAAKPNTWDTIWWVEAFRTLGKAEVPIWLVALFAVVTRRTKPLVATLLALVLSTSLVIPLKSITQRPRPNAVLHIQKESASPKPLYDSTKASFPSGDTSTAFAVATAVATSVSGVWWPLLYSGATAIGVLRVTRLSHFPSDVFAGAAIGILAGYVALRLCRSYPRLDLPDLPARSVWRGVLACIVLATPLLLFLLKPQNPLVVFLKVYGIPVLIMNGVLFFLERSRRPTTEP